MSKQTNAFIAAALLIPMLAATSCGGAAALVDVVYPPKISENRIEFRQENELSVDFIASLEHFACDTAGIVLAEEGNQNFSPLSLYYALSLAAAGAGGETEAELLGLLGADSSEALAEQCARLFRLLYNASEYTTLTLADSVWSAKPLLADFAKTAAESFYAECYEVDFTDAKTADLMSGWISKHTGGTLKPEIELDPEQLLTIINTVYYADEWTDRFDKSQTESGSFHAPEGDVTVDFMNRKTQGSFSRGEDYIRSTLGLKGGSMTFILPDEGTDVRELLDREGLDELFYGGEDGFGDVNWSVPKFSFDTKLKLRDMLTSLGIESMFGTDADFTAMTGESPLFVSNIEQGTHIALDEKGVTASAYTELMYCGAAMPTDSADMTLDRPFIYVISSNGTIIFVGIVENPTQK